MGQSFRAGGGYEERWISILERWLRPAKVCKSIIWVVVSNIFHFHPYLVKWSNLTSIFFRWIGSSTNYSEMKKPTIVTLKRDKKGVFLFFHWTTMKRKDNWEKPSDKKLTPESPLEGAPRSAHFPTTFLMKTAERCFFWKSSVKKMALIK